MVERNADGSLKVVAQLPNDNWLREDGQVIRSKMIFEVERLGRLLTDEEKAEIRRSLTTE